jgi:hypothetical protein
MELIPRRPEFQNVRQARAHLETSICGCGGGRRDQRKSLESSPPPKSKEEPGDAYQSRFPEIMLFYRSPEAEQHPVIGVVGERVLRPFCGLFVSAESTG